MLDGVYEGVYYHDGFKTPYYGLVQWEGDYYYVADYAEVVCNEKKYVSNTNGLTWADGTPIAKGNYEFGADGKMIIKNGPQADGFFYVNGTQLKAYQLVKYEGAYYFVAEYNKYVVDKSVTLTKDRLAAAGLDLVAGKYYFDAEGKLVIPEPKNGPQADGYFYVNDVKQTGYKLLEYNGNYYFVGDYNKYAVNKFVTLTRARLDEAGLTDVPAGKYEFDAEGKMIIVIPEPKNGPQADGFFYIDDVKLTGYQLLEYNGAYYFIGDFNKYVVNKSVTLTRERLASVGLDLPTGKYNFGADGKLILE
jgi:hypothetical protein